MLHLQIHPQTPQERHIKTIANMLRNDSLLLYPTDSGYAIGCSAASSRAINKLYALKKPIKKSFYGSDFARYFQSDRLCKNQ